MQTPSDHLLRSVQAGSQPVASTAAEPVSLSNTVPQQGCAEVELTWHAGPEVPQEDYSVSTSPSPAHLTPLSTCSTAQHIPALPFASSAGHLPPAPAKVCHATCTGETKSLPWYAPKNCLSPRLTPGQPTLCSVCSCFCCPAL